MISERLRHRLHTIIYEADTPQGNLFDLALLCMILLSVFVVMLESIYSVNLILGGELKIIEWFITICFTI